MIVEAAAGIAFGSIALPDDGLHRASHAITLSSVLLPTSTAVEKPEIRVSCAGGVSSVNGNGDETAAVLEPHPGLRPHAAPSS